MTLKSPDTFIPRGTPSDQLGVLMGDTVRFFFGKDMCVVETRIPAGQILVQHKHDYNHLSILASGRIILEVDGVTSWLTGPVCLDIEAGKHHGVKALTDVLWYCIHPDKPDGHAAVADPSDVAGAKLIEEKLKWLG